MFAYAILYFLLFSIYFAVTIVSIIAIDAGFFGDRSACKRPKTWRHWAKLTAASFMFFSAQEVDVLGRRDATYTYAQSIVSECKAALDSYSLESNGYYKQCLSGCSFSRWVCFTLL
jgi:hypothetical protein